MGHIDQFILVNLVTLKFKDIHGSFNRTQHLKIVQYRYVDHWEDNFLLNYVFCSQSRLHAS